MPLSNGTKSNIKDRLVSKIREKLSNYDPETKYMPFHFRLFGRDRYAMFSFIQSINTTFGISVWEQVAEVLALGAGYQAERQHRLLGEINERTATIISDIHYKLRSGEISSNNFEEVNLIRDSISEGDPKVDPDSVVDFLVKRGDEENYFDITSAKPNMKEFSALKLKLLRWTALRLSQVSNANVITRLAIPYNPYHPEPYQRWTLSGMYDLGNDEILVGEEFWNFVANDEIYNELLDVFQEAGELLRDEIDEKFREFQTIEDR